ncbi:hypothetical protein KI387_000812, partial [Taxus chinensis]
VEDNDPEMELTLNLHTTLSCYKIATMQDDFSELEKNRSLNDTTAKLSCLLSCVTQMPTPREHVEQIRSCKFSIGQEDNPLIEDLHQAVKRLSAELYTKDVHFLMELIQNAEDNYYPPNVEPSLEFFITSRDITAVGAPATLLVFYNEMGFTSSNIESLCSVGRSTKKGKKQGSYIGEKGIGFKSVFLVMRQPYIFSNGYQIRFNEVPPMDTKIGYIVPEWVDEKPKIKDILEVYGGKHRTNTKLPNTIIILPLRPEKVEAVKYQLAKIHPEVILFMSKIKKLSILGDKKNFDNTISVSKEAIFQTLKDKQSETFILHLSSKENPKSSKPNGKCSYYMWKQKFPVKTQNKVEGREEVDNWVITLAFPRQERVTTRNKMGTGIYAFLPTEMVTGFPFIIQADFLLVSSRESITWDNTWNKGILDCIPSAFCSAFLFFVKNLAPASSRSYCCDKYLPINDPCYPELKRVRDAIRTKLKTQEVILCEHQFCTPLQARRILPAFRNILQKATDQCGLQKPSALWSSGVFVVHPCMDNSPSLEFLGVQYISYEWYSQCIQTPGFVAGLSEDLYVQVLWFLAEYWERGVSTNIHLFLLFKYECNGYLPSVGWTTLSDLSSSKGLKIYFSARVEDIGWLTRWNNELGDATNCKFMPKDTQMAMKKLCYNQCTSLHTWLKHYPKIVELSVSDFIKKVIEKAKASTSKEFVIRVTQLLHFSSENNYISSIEMANVCLQLPLVNDSGCIISTCEVKLVPAAIGNWAKLMGKNPWTAQGFVTLSPAYMNPPRCAGGLKGGQEEDIKFFMNNELQAKDIPHLRPPNAMLPGFSFPIGVEKALLLLEWIQNLTMNMKVSLPTEFKRSIVEGKWLKTYRGYQSPNMSFLLDAQWFTGGVELNDLYFIDSAFYKKPMADFRDALQELGVIVEYGKGCEVVYQHLQMHTDFKAITRLYKYLQRLKWTPSDRNSVKVWVPVDGGNGGEWKDAEMCVVHDDNGLFHERLEILENTYEAALLPYFSTHLGVPLGPKVEDYCNLWLHWIVHNHSVTGQECCSVWRNFLMHWSKYSSTIRLHLGTDSLKLPTCTNNGQIELCAPNETFVPDDLRLKELFQIESSRTKFAWYPNPSDPQIQLDLLFSIYNSLGARNISQGVEKNEVSVSKDNVLHKLRLGKRLFKKGLYRIVLGYLAHHTHKLSPDKRHEIMRTLLESSAYEVTMPFMVVYSVSLMREDGQTETIEATTYSPVHWEKHKKRILMHKSDGRNKRAKVSLATNFAETISRGLLPEYPSLVAGLSEMLKFGYILGFDEDVVNPMPQYKNFLLFEEDENFLSPFFQESNEDHVREQFSPEGWEKRLHVFQQAMDNMKEPASNSMKMKLVKLLFPSATPDKQHPKSCSGIHLMKVLGDACLKMLIASEVLGACDDETGEVMSFKLDNLISEEVLELGKCFGQGGNTNQAPSAAAVQECDFEMLKAIAGAATLRFYEAEV